MANDEPVMDISHSMVEITEEDLFGGDVAELTKVMQELVAEAETEEYDEEMVNEVNEVTRSAFFKNQHFSSVHILQRTCNIIYYY